MPVRRPVSSGPARPATVPGLVPALALVLGLALALPAPAAGPEDPLEEARRLLEARRPGEAAALLAGAGAAGSDAREQGEIHFTLGAARQLQAEGLPPEQARPLLLEAVASYRQALDLLGDHPVVLGNLAVALGDLGRDREAEEAFLRAVAGSDRSQGAFVSRNYAELLVRRGRWADAAGVYREALAMEPADREAHRALVELLRERFPDDLPEYLQALVDRGQSLWAEEIAGEELLAPGRPPHLREAHLAVLAAALARRPGPPGAVLETPVADVLAQARDDPGIDPRIGVRAGELLALHGAATEGDALHRLDPARFAWWAEGDGGANGEEAPRLEALRKLLHSLAVRTGDPVAEWDYARLAVAVDPTRPDRWAARRLVDASFETGRLDRLAEVLPIESWEDAAPETVAALTDALCESATPVAGTCPRSFGEAVQAALGVSEPAMFPLPPRSELELALADLQRSLFADRIDVGRNESGQQAGAFSQEVTFTVDTTPEAVEQAALGHAPAAETGAYRRSAGRVWSFPRDPGLLLDLVTRPAPDRLQGSVAFDLAPDGLHGRTDAGDLGTPAGESLPAGALARPGRGGELHGALGGPLVDERLFLSGAYAERRRDLVAHGGEPVEERRRHLDLKLGWSARHGALTARLAGGAADVTAAGAAPDRLRESTWHEDAVSALAELQWSWVRAVGPARNGAFLTVAGSASYLAEALDRVPLGGLDTPAARNAEGVVRGSFGRLERDRPTLSLELSGAVGWSRGDSSHEASVGAQYWAADTEEALRWPGSLETFHVDGELFGLDPGPVEVAQAARSGTVRMEGRRLGLWVQERLTRRRLTLRAGLRYDRQEGSNRPGRAGASPVAPDLLPPLDFGGAGPAFTWETLSPRLGLGYVLSDRWGAVLHLSFDRYAQQLPAELIALSNPLAPAYAYFLFSDQNGDGLLDPGDAASFYYAEGFDPSAPHRGLPAHRIDPDLEPAITDRWGLGIETRPTVDLSVDLSARYLTTSGVIERRELVRDETGNKRVATADDWVVDGFVEGRLPDGAAYSRPFFTLRPGLRHAGGALWTNGARRQESLGIDAEVRWRRGDRFELRGRLAWSRSRWDVPASFFRTRTPTDTVEPGDSHGAPVAEEVGGLGGVGGVWIEDPWTAGLAGRYSVAPERRWGFSVAGELSLREGSPQPLYRPAAPSNSPAVRVAVAEFDRFTAEERLRLDLFLDKTWTGGEWSLGLRAEVLNALDETPATHWERNLALGRALTAYRTALPRTVTLGVRIGYGR